MDAIMKQRDQFMGANRHGDVTEVDRKYYDRDICRLYLVGLCPHELFQLTKMDMGPCPKVHSLQLRKESRDRDRYHERDSGYDRERECDLDYDCPCSYHSRSRSRLHSRSRERSRDYDQHRRYDCY